MFGNRTKSLGAITAQFTQVQDDLQVFMDESANKADALNDKIDSLTGDLNVVIDEGTRAARIKSKLSALLD